MLSFSEKVENKNVIIIGAGTIVACWLFSALSRWGKV